MNTATPHIALHVGETTRTGIPTKKLLLWVSIGSILMLFAAFTSAYIVSKADSFWVVAPLPKMFYISTCVIAFSSLSLYWAYAAAKKNNFSTVKKGLLITLLLGVGFVFTQYLSWSELVSSGRFFVGNIKSIKGEYGKDYLLTFNSRPLEFSAGNFYLTVDEKLKKDMDTLRLFKNWKLPITPSTSKVLVDPEKLNQSFNRSSSFLYILSGLHVIHLLGGIIGLLVVLPGTFKKKYHSGNMLGLEMCSIYWHFLGVLWIYLLLFLVYMH